MVLYNVLHTVIVYLVVAPLLPTPQCPEGFSFYLPLTGYENWQLFQSIRSSSQDSYVWLNWKDSMKYVEFCDAHNFDCNN